MSKAKPKDIQAERVQQRKSRKREKASTAPFPFLHPAYFVYVHMPLSLAFNKTTFHCGLLQFAITLVGNNLRICMPCAGQN